jgi:hypothetical protein
MEKTNIDFIDGECISVKDRDSQKFTIHTNSKKSMKQTNTNEETEQYTLVPCGTKTMLQIDGKQSKRMIADKFKKCRGEIPCQAAGGSRSRSRSRKSHRRKSRHLRTRRRK